MNNKGPRAEAIAKGELTYFTGKSCKHGHISPRQTSNSICIQCGKEIYMPKDRENYRHKDTFYRQFLNRKQVAIRNNIPFTIEFSQIEQPTHCPILGLSLIHI